MKLETLPPTSSAADYHSFRVYHQVQFWLGNEKNPIEWGWHMTTTGLQPTTAESGALVPDNIIHAISCSCKSDCKSRCSCKKNGLFCTEVCANCHGEACDNVQISMVVESEDSNDNSDLPVLTIDHYNLDLDLTNENDDNENESENVSLSEMYEPVNKKRKLL